jgi:hypothetical protein
MCFLQQTFYVSDTTECQYGGFQAGVSPYNVGWVIVLANGETPQYKKKNGIQH